MNENTRNQIMSRVRENLENSGELGEPLNDEACIELIKEAASELLVIIAEHEIDELFDSVLSISSALTANSYNEAASEAVELAGGLLGGDCLLVGLDWAEGLFD